MKKCSFYNSATSFYNLETPLCCRIPTFVVLFHSTISIMQIPLFLAIVLLESLVSCRYIDPYLPVPETCNVSLAAIAPLPPSDCGTETAAVAFRTTDNGQTWDNISTGLSDDMLISDVLASNGNLYIAAEQGLFAGNAAILPTVWEKDPHMTDKIWNLYPGQSGMYASSQQNELIKEIPAAGIWISLKEGLQRTNAHCFLESPDGSLYVGCDSGILRSTDGGGHWEPVYKGGIVTHLAFDRGTLVACGHSGMLRTDDGGLHWEPFLHEAGELFQVESVESGLVAISRGIPLWDSFHLTGNRLLFSVDRGKNWDNIGAGLPSGNVYNAVRTGGFLFCSHKNGIFRYSEKGKNWEMVFRSPHPEKAIMLATSGTAVIAVFFNGGC